METKDLTTRDFIIDMGSENRGSSTGQKVKTLAIQSAYKVRFWWNNTPRLWRRWCERRKANNPKKVIRLAVVGAKSSGKSFFLRDIIDALSARGCSRDKLYRTGFYYKSFDRFERNQTQTDVYVCRHENHFGQVVNMDRKTFELDFLNIPGEIFRTKENIQHYKELHDKLDVNSKLFTVTSYISESSDEEILIVEARWKSTITDTDRSYASPPSMLSNTRFLNWQEIFGSLNSKGFKPLEGSRRHVSGKTLLKNFFEYHTDSAMQSISDLLKTRQIDVSFSDADFDGQNINKAFIFFQYCTLATDMVICDRVFVKVEDTQEDMNFVSMVEHLASFLDTRERRMPNVFLALRNVDYLLKQKEDNYKELDSVILKGQWAEEVEKDRKRNAIYSLFYYAMLNHLYGYTIKDKDFNAKIGIPQGFTGIDKDITHIVANYLDLTFNGGYVHNPTGNLKLHILTRIGSSGQAFRRILDQTGCKQKNEPVPHVYFTCTPITEDYDIYENRIPEEGGDQYEPNEFYREGINDRFSERGSCACFGSYQLLTDILVQHGILNSPTVGLLLRELQAKQ